MAIGGMLQGHVGLKHGRCTMRHQDLCGLAQQLVPPLQEQIAKTRRQTPARQTSQLPDLQQAQLFEQRDRVGWQP